MSFWWKTSSVRYCSNISKVSQVVALDRMYTYKVNSLNLFVADCLL